MMTMSIQNPPDDFAAAMQSEFDRLDQQRRESGECTEDRREAENILRMVAHRKDEKARLDAYHKAETARLDREIAGIWAWRGHLVQEAVARIIQGQKNKSIKTPWGRVGYRTRSKPAVAFDPQDEAVVLDWAKEYCPEAVYVPTPPPPRPRLRKEALAEFLMKAKALCPGVTVRPPGEDFYYDTKRRERPDDPE